VKPFFETVKTDENSSFHVHHYTCKNFVDDHPWHYHPEFELAWTLRSSGIRFIGDSTERYEPNDLVLVGPNLPHCWHDMDGETNLESPEVIVVQFRTDCFGTDFLELAEAAPIKDLFDKSRRGLQITGPTAGLVTALLKAMLDKKGLDRLTCLLNILHVLTQRHDLRPLASANYQINSHVTESNMRRIEFVYRYVRDHLGANISQSDVAHKIGLTPPAFSRFFRRATSQTFVSFVNGLRINEVCRQLMRDNVSITDVAMSCGYNNLANFHRQFLAVKGITPRQFREERRHLLERKASSIYSLVDPVRWVEHRDANGRASRTVS